MTSQTLNITQALVAKLQNLPPEQQQTVLDFIKFLEQKYIKKQSNQNSSQKRIFGLHEGQGWMSEDFNDPLPDEFWVGEE